MNLHINAGPTKLPSEPEVEQLAASQPPATVARRFPASPLAWANLAQAAWNDGETLESYAYARVGYHRGLDRLRKSGWRGSGSVPMSHEPNMAFLRCLYYLGRAAAAIDEDDEVSRITEFLDECDPGIRDFFTDQD